MKWQETGDKAHAISTFNTLVCLGLQVWTSMPELSPSAHDILLRCYLSLCMTYYTACGMLWAKCMHVCSCIYQRVYTCMHVPEQDLIQGSTQDCTYLTLGEDTLSDKWMDGWMNGWMSEWMSEWVSERSSEWMSEWVSERSSEWMSECVVLTFMICSSIICRLLSAHVCLSHVILRSCRLDWYWPPVFPALIVLLLLGLGHLYLANSGCYNQLLNLGHL